VSKSRWPASDAQRFALPDNDVNDATAIEKFQSATSATSRALARDSELHLQFAQADADADAQDTGERKIKLPPDSLPYEKVCCARGAADSMALRVRYHDAGVHAQQAPGGLLHRAIFDALEQARCESVGSAHKVGVEQNLAAALNAKLAESTLYSAPERDPGQLPMVLDLLVRESLFGTTPPPHGRHLVDMWRPYLEPKLHQHLRQLRKSTADQADFASSVKHMLDDLALEDVAQEPQPDDDDAPDSEADSDGAQQQASEDGSEEGDEQQRQGSDADAADEDGDALTLDAQGDDDLADSDAEGQPPQYFPSGMPSGGDAYKVYSTEYDEVVQAEQLCDAEELARLRQLLDQQLSNQQAVIARLANRLQRFVLARQTRAWLFDQEEGILDTARLARVVANPTHPLSFKRERETTFRDSVLALLIDNSGSMRGRPITIAAMSADILARTLERCGVKVEVLGFTTRAWKGGQSRERWLAAGKPSNPGRLNDLRHVIYKSADSPWRRARRSFGLMLREGLLKENVDGEALLWAHQRLLERPEQRRFLIVISDGAPVDDSTLSVNSGHYLEQHLKLAIEYVENSSPVELLAIGIGHDVTRYYRRAVTLTDAEQLGETMVDKITELFDLH